MNHTFLNYEKSANYFDDIKSPRRIKKLIRQPKLVAFLKNPIDRAYSWYQVIILFSFFSLYCIKRNIIIIACKGKKWFNSKKLFILRNITINKCFVGRNVPTKIKMFNSWNILQTFDSVVDRVFFQANLSH